MLSVIIPTKNAGQTLIPVLAALVPASADGIVREVVLADAGSGDLTIHYGEEAGCTIISTQEGDAALIDGARAARRSNWLLFLEQDVVLEPGWHFDAAKFIERQERLGPNRPVAAVHRFAIEDEGFGARFDEVMMTMRARLFGWASPEQGVVISRRHFEKISAARARFSIGRGQLRELRSNAFTTSARRRERTAAHTAF